MRTRTAALVAFTVVILALMVAGRAGATPVFLSPVNVSDPGQDGFEPQIAEDPSGNVEMVWTRKDGANFRIQARFRQANGGPWGPVETLSDPGQDASQPQVAFDPSGDAIAVWSRNDGTNVRIQSAFRPAGGSFGAVQTISAAGQSADKPNVAVDGSGKAVAVWTRSDGANFRIEAAVRPPAGTFGAPQTLSDPGQDALEPQAATGSDLDTTAAVVWERSDGASTRVQSARRQDVVGYPRPKGATPIRVSLVPAYQQCTAPNSTHGPALSSPSCNPPVRSSSVLTIGTPDANGFAANSFGSVKLDAIVGNPSNTIDDADLRLILSITDVRNSPSGTDYTGRVLATASMQITDRNNADENPATGTVQTIPLQFPANCTATSDGAVGGTCAASTTLDALIPGAVQENQRTIEEIGQIQVKDAGPNGTGYAACPPTCGDGDETVFMRQGVFVP